MVRIGRFKAPDAHVLVVDDSLMNIRVVEGLLKEYQIKVTHATSGQEALKIIEQMCFDFVFMDHMMPEMDGVETMHRIRDKAGRYYQKVPIIALTANAVPGNQEMFLEEGFNDFLAKPLEISVLERVLKRNLPEEKLVFLADSTPKPAAKKPKPQSGSVHLHELQIGDLDVQQALLYCGGKKAYLDVLECCFEEGEQERQTLEELYEKQDWKNYTIQIHALKSSMRSIGAMPLSEKAKALEKAGKNGDISYIFEAHKDMIEEHVRVMEELSQCPLLHPHLPKEPSQPEEQHHADNPDLPKMDEQMFDRVIEELEDAAYSLDGDEMLAVLSRMQGYQYCQTALGEKLAPAKKKVEMSDYMSAADFVFKIREELKNNQKGGGEK